MKILTGVGGENFTTLSTVEIDEKDFVQKRRGQGWRNQKYDNREFIAWDGEGWTDHHESCYSNDALNCAGKCQHHYYLFGCSVSTGISGRSLSTRDCLAHIIDVGKRNPYGIHIGFAFSYDVNMILKDLPPKYMMRLKENTFVHWYGYRIEHIPKKWFTVSYGKTSVRIQDIFSFFACSFVKALRGWNVGTEDEISDIESGKDARGNFSLDSLETTVRPYWRKELLLLVSLGDKLRSILYSAGLNITNWYGPGNIASFLYQKNQTEDCMDKALPRGVIDAAAYAYAGGRFEGFKAGYYEGTIYSADINSAYPAAMAELPNLRTGRWRLESGWDPRVPVSSRMGLFRIFFVFRYEFVALARQQGLPLPVFHRRKSGQVWYPEMSDGWYHAPEAQILFDIWNNSKGKAFSHFETSEAWIYEDDGSYPFDWVREMYSQRAVWKAQGNPAQLALKLGINSLYGKLAQRIGHKDGQSPKWHQLEWAGAITSATRAKLYNAMAGDWQHIIAVETDGIYSTQPFSNLDGLGGVGSGLGQWECTEYTGIIFLQNGVYWLRDQNGNWLPPKSRGIPQKQLDRDAAMRALVGRKDLVAYQHQFIGYGTALHRKPNTMDSWRTWITAEKRFEFGGNGKRFHDETTCPECSQGLGWDSALHTLSLRKGIPSMDSIRSAKHALPWLDEMYDGIEDLKHELRWEIIAD